MTEVETRHAFEALFRLVPSKLPGLLPSADSLAAFSASAQLCGGQAFSTEGEEIRGLAALRKQEMLDWLQEHHPLVGGKFPW